VRRDARLSRRYFVLAALAVCFLVIGPVMRIFTAWDVLGSMLGLIGAILVCVALWIGHLDRQKAS
jgi:protein-S-isoprenylcysteine O-methyltransferase Ste14